MNAKHYVSLDAAKKLKELGYNDEYQVHYYNNNGEIVTPWCGDDDYNEDEHYPCVSLLEAMDWLEERGMSINVYLLESFKHKGFTYCIAFADVKNNIYSNDNNEFFPDKYSAYHAAIIKACEML